MDTDTVVQIFYRRARAYDLDYAEYMVDIPFNVQLARELTAKVEDGGMLEFACGTGRITFPVADAGVEITGLDISPSMLAVAWEKYDAKVGEPRPATFLEGDMRSYNAGLGQYQYVLVPFTSFLHLTTRQDQQATLANAYAHLLPDGYFLADIFLPDVAHLARNLGPNWVNQEKAVTHGDTMLVRWTTTRYDQSTQLMTGNWYYQVYEATGERKLIESYWVPMELRVIFPAEWELLLEHAGFRIVEKWGDFNRAPWGPKANRMLWLCQK